MNSKVNGSFATADDAYAWSKNADWASLSNEGQLALQDFLAAYADYQKAVEALGEVTGTASNQERLNSLNNTLSTLKAKLAEVQAITVSSNGDYNDAQNRLNKAIQNITEINKANQQSQAAQQKKTPNAQAAHKNAQTE